MLFGIWFACILWLRNHAFFSQALVWWFSMTSAALVSPPRVHVCVCKCEWEGGAFLGVKGVSQLLLKVPCQMSVSRQSVAHWKSANFLWPHKQISDPWPDQTLPVSVSTKRSLTFVCRYNNMLFYVHKCVCLMYSACSLGCRLLFWKIKDYSSLGKCHFLLSRHLAILPLSACIIKTLPILLIGSD